MTRFLSQSIRKRAVLGLSALGLSLLLSLSPAFAQSVIRDAEIEELLRDYADPLFEVAGLEGEDIDLNVINSSDLNAFVAGGQNMFIFTGLILAAETPNELIGVMAHETGHISGGHLARMSGAASSVSIPAYVGAAIGVGLLIAGMPEVGMAMIMGGQTMAQGEFLAYSRTQEAAADQAAMNFMTATEQSGEGLLTFFDRFRDQEAMMGINQDAYVRSHPLNQDRIGLLEQRIAHSEFLGVEDTPESIHRLRMVQAKIRGFLERPDLTLLNYPETDLSMPGHYARAIAYYLEGRTDQALAQIDHLVAIEPDNAYFQELRGQILFEGGRVAESVVVHRRSVELRPDIPLLRINLSQSLLALNETDEGGDSDANQEALHNLQFAVAHEHDNAFAWYQMSIAYGRAGENGRADLAVAEQSYAVRDMDRAREFAIRAQDKLPEDSVQWNRAMDIIYLTRRGQPRAGR